LKRFSFNDDFLRMLIRPLPYRDPLAYAEPFARDAHAVFLDSAAPRDGKGRYSYIAADPYRVITYQRGDGPDPFAALEQELRAHKEDAENAPVPFAGGAVGCLGYELGGRLERLPAPRADALHVPLMVMGFYGVVAAFDHAERTAWLLGSGLPEAELAARADALAERLVTAPQQPSPLDWTARGGWQAELARDDIERRIARIVDYIRAGDIFQANFTQRFRARRPSGLDAFTLYRRLRAVNPAPFAAFLNGGTFSMIGASPELFLRVRGDRAEAHPIKGTRPRDADAARDAVLAAELRASAKDRAENLMIVDLMRNDLSRVCQPGSVRVPHLCAPESFASVHHLTSVIMGRLQAGVGPVDLLRASFPGGSVTGAPKIRAMEIIHELEPAPRHFYCGCLGWIGFNGAMDMSMTIRTLTMAGDTILAQAGGGIVADSDPTAEYEESMIKAAALLHALTGDAP
jgi:para-aminobenzoate synthetase component 1